MSNNTQDDRSRPVRSYVIRAGRLTRSQRKALDQYGHKFIVPYSNTPIDLAAVFPQTGPLNVEIGFGMGDSLLAMAADQPDHNFLGIEVHPPGVGKALMGIVEKELSNLRIIQHDAKEVLQHAIAPNSVDRLLVLFPDPWPKKRHHKRRLIQPGFISLAASRLQPNGVIHLATDWEEYAQQMLQVLEAEAQLDNVIAPEEFWSQPERPATKFEQRGQRLGHGVWDLLFRKRATG